MAACALVLIHSSVSFGQEATPEQAPKLQFRVLQTRRISLGNRSVIFNRVAPPVLPKKPLVSAPLVATPTAGELKALEEMQAKQVQKKQEALFISATVFNNAVTELYWTYDGRQCHAFSNINFNYFGGVTEFEANDTVYWLLMAIMNDQVASGDATKQAGAAAATPARQAKEIPALSEFSPRRSEYLVVEGEGEPLPDEAFAGIEALHVYFDANRPRLIEESVKRDAAQLAQEQWLKDHPPVPKDTVINFWPIKSRVYGNAPQAEEKK